MKVEEDHCSGNHDGGDDTTDSRAPTLESGPKFHANERVLCTDSQQQQARGAATTNNLPPLYEAIIRKSGLKYVDPKSKKILPERRKRGGRHRQHHHDQHQQDSEVGVKEWCHLIHFQGWNNRWDRWMTESEVFRDTPENRERVGASSIGKCARTHPKPKEEEKKKKKRGRPKDDNGAYVDDDWESDARDGSIFQQNLRLVAKSSALPFTLQTILVDDREKITKRIYPPPAFNFNDSEEKPRKGIKMLHVLPAKINIINVMGGYIRSKKQEDLEEFAREQNRLREEEDKQQNFPQKSTTSDKDGNSEGGQKSAKSTDEHSTKDDKEITFPSAISTKAILKRKKQKRKQFALSIIALVDISLPLFLLYNEEREQLSKMMRGDCVNCNGSGVPARGGDDDGDVSGNGQKNTYKRPSELYGAEHLLRFFVKLPYILSQYEPKDADAMGVDDRGTNTYILASKDLSQEFADHILELIVFLQKNLDFFKGKYFAVELM